LGRSAKSDEFLSADGNVLSNQNLSKLVTGESGLNYTAGKLEIYGATPCLAGVDEKRERGFFWRRRLSRRQRNTGKLRYAWSLHPKIMLPKSLPYPRLRLTDMRPKLLNALFSNQSMFFKFGLKDLS